MSDIVPRQRLRELELAARMRGMLVIQLNRFDVEVTEEWLLGVLPEAPRQQILEAALVIVTDPSARLAKVVKSTAIRGEYLDMHTAVIG